MTRKFSLVAGLLLSSLTVGSLLAQGAPAAPGARPMHHDSVATSSSTRAAMRHTVWTKDQIKEAQQGLAKAGYYKAEATGVFNRKTRKAIRAYQKANKLPVTGRLSDDLLARLHSA
jgi:peptidoglycan hydrolase-like protein with peptidoglycan-binding domain